MDTMKGLILIIIGILLLSASTIHADEWTERDTAFEIASLTPYVLDWMQTRQIANNGCHEYREWKEGVKYYWEEKNCIETNPILGESPSEGDVNLYFAASIAGHVLISRLLPNPYRRYWQILTFGIETGFVIHNNSIGLEIKF